MTSKSYSRLLIITLLSSILIASIAVAICVGPTWVNPLSLVNYLLLKGWDGSDTAAVIIFQVRLPRVLIAALVGACLAVAGVVFQAILRNPLGSPFILGASSGAAFGATLAFALGLDVTLGILNPVSFFAIFGALLSIFLVLNISRVSGKFPTFTLILSGVMINSFFSAASMFIISISRPEQVHRITIWLMGQIQSVEYSQIIFVSLSFLVSLVILFWFAMALNVMQMGEENALWLGVEAEKVKIIVFIVASVLTGIAVTVSGLIGFVGLMVPHLMRIIFGPDHRLLLPASALGGAIFLVITDTLARVIMSPAELPVGVVTAMIGVPFFIYLLKRRRKLISI